MSKKAKAKKLMVSGVLFATLVGGVSESAFAEVSAVGVESAQSNTLHQSVGTYLNAALAMLRESDFTKEGSFEEMSTTFMNAYKIVYGENSDNTITADDIKNVELALAEINSSYNSIVGRIQHAISGLNIQFTNGSLEGKEIAVAQLDQIIKEETDLNYEYVNKTTIDSATKILDQYKLKLELARAVHEAKYTEQLLKEHDFTQNGSFEYMSSFIRAAVQRVDGVRFNGIENEDTKYVYDVLAKVNRSYNSIVGRIQHAIHGLEVQFANGSPEGQQIAVQQLEQIIAEDKEYVNNKTITEATKILDQYKAKLAAPQTAEVLTGTKQEQLSYGLKEVELTTGMLETADFTKQGQWELMSSYLKAAVDRADWLRGEGVDFSQVKVIYDTLDKVNRSYNSVVARIQHAINGLEVQFNQGGLEGQEIAVAQLDQIIKEESNLNFEYVNKTTIDSATKILDQYKLKLELARAVHEAKLTEKMLNEADFSKYGNWELMASYIGAAVDRVNGVRFNGIENEDTKYVYDTLAKVNNSYNSIVGRILHALSTLESQYYHGTEENRAIDYNTLMTILEEEHSFGIVNSATLEGAAEKAKAYSKENPDRK
ncbi:hypothetical protein MHH52_23975 [Paenibacillus sp. FSL K6-0276]|uniref:hypothetical protein n=1 Tax=Paenibacillus sp. FSL K6-0276 TaxID=2921450 RepID=UPI0030EC40DF